LKVSGQLHASAALSLKKKPPIPIGKETGISSVWRRENI
jgi:hypothetical protein